jgi:diguanylate cyclase (GGDEF)-like protein
MEAQWPANETSRIAALHDYDILDSPAEQSFDDLARLAALICDMPIALISFVDGDRQWFKAKVGLEFSQTPRSQSLCAHAILAPDAVLVRQDLSMDARFAGMSTVVSEPNVRFYAGAPMVTGAGYALGTVCVMDRVPRTLTPEMEDALQALSRQATALLELRRTQARLKKTTTDLAEQQYLLDDCRARIEELHVAQRDQSVTDALTGLKNRKAFDAVMNEQSSRTERSHSPLALAIVDVDHFKAFNDQHGRAMGDEALQQVALVLASHARTYDYVARYGGDEFALVLPDTSLDAALIVAERVRKAVHELQWDQMPLTISVGVATTTTAHDSMTVVERAAGALAQCKRDGRNCVVLAKTP